MLIGSREREDPRTIRAVRIARCYGVIVIFRWALYHCSKDGRMVRLLVMDDLMSG